MYITSTKFYLAEKYVQILKSCTIIQWYEIDKFIHHEFDQT